MQTAVKSCCGILILANSIPVPAWLVWSLSPIIAPKLHSSIVAGAAHKPLLKTKKKVHIRWRAGPALVHHRKPKRAPEGSQPCSGSSSSRWGWVIGNLLRYQVLDKVPQPALQRSAALVLWKSDPVDFRYPLAVMADICLLWPKLPVRACRY